MDAMLDEVDDVDGLQKGDPSSSTGDGALAFTPPRLLLVPLLRFQAEFVVWAQGQEQNETVRGGVLADEMGMGKVCVISFVPPTTHLFPDVHGGRSRSGGGDGSGMSTYRSIVLCEKSMCVCVCVYMYVYDRKVWRRMSAETMLRVFLTHI